MRTPSPEQIPDSKSGCLGGLVHSVANVLLHLSHFSFRRTPHPLSEEKPDSAPLSRVKNLLERFDHPLDPRIFEKLGFPIEQYYESIRNTHRVWLEHLPENADKYLLFALGAVQPLVHTPEELHETSNFLAISTAKIYKNGSYDFISQAVPSMVQSGLVTNLEELKEGVNLLLKHVEPLEHGEHLYHQFSDMVLAQHISKLSDIPDLTKELSPSGVHLRLRRDG